MRLQKIPTFQDLLKLFRDDRFWKIAGQAIAAICLIIFVLSLSRNLIANLHQLGIKLGFDFLNSQASFDIGESLIPYDPSSSFIQAILVGLINSLRIMILGIIFATIVGLTVGIARLSDNWLVRQLAGIYVEVLRNTPLLLQLLFWYSAVFIALPKLEGNTQHSGPIYWTNRGIAIPWFQATPSTGLWFAFLGGGAIAAVLLGQWRTRQQIERGEASRQWLWSGGAIAISALFAFLWTRETPFDLDFPYITSSFQIAGGLKLTPEFSALLTGLTLYTASFIAEIVRAGIQAVPKGQWEAGKALGLQPGVLLRLVVLPQALRVIVPPLTSQYLNLMKNSSLAVATGYPDLYFVVASPMLSQTGRAVEAMTIIMVTYLSFSLTISLAMNLYNKTVQLKER